jgi:hypothetical protein
MKKRSRQMLRIAKRFCAPTVFLTRREWNAFPIRMRVLREFAAGQLLAAPADLAGSRVCRFIHIVVNE